VAFCSEKAPTQIRRGQVLKSSLDAPSGTVKREFERRERMAAQVESQVEAAVRQQFGQRAGFFNKRLP
jgi:hypothetical protein